MLAVYTLMPNLSSCDLPLNHHVIMWPFYCVIMWSCDPSIELSCDPSIGWSCDRVTLLLCHHVISCALVPPPVLHAPNPTTTPGILQAHSKHHQSIPNAMLLGPNLPGKLSCSYHIVMSLSHTPSLLLLPYISWWHWLTCLQPMACPRGAALFWESSSSWQLWHNSYGSCHWWVWWCPAHHTLAARDWIIMDICLHTHIHTYTYTHTTHTHTTYTYTGCEPLAQLDGTEQW